MIQVKLQPLPVHNGAWAAHIQYGGFGIKNEGDYQSAQCLLTAEQALAIMTGVRSTSFRFSSTEAYFVEDATSTSAEEDIYFGGNKMPFNRQAVLDLIETNKPINPELEAATPQLLQAVGEAWEKQHRDFVAQKEGKAPKTLMH